MRVESRFSCGEIFFSPLNHKKNVASMQMFFVDGVHKIFRNRGIKNPKRSFFSTPIQMICIGVQKHRATPPPTSLDNPEKVTRHFNFFTPYSLPGSRVHNPLSTLSDVSEWSAILTTTSTGSVHTPTLPAPSYSTPLILATFIVEFIRPAEQPTQHSNTLGLLANLATAKPDDSDCVEWFLSANASGFWISCSLRWFMILYFGGAWNKESKIRK